MATIQIPDTNHKNINKSNICVWKYILKCVNCPFYWFWRMLKSLEATTAKTWSQSQSTYSCKWDSAIANAKVCLWSTVANQVRGRVELFNVHFAAITIISDYCAFFESLQRVNTTLSNSCPLSKELHCYCQNKVGTYFVSCYTQHKHPRSEWQIVPRVYAHQLVWH